MKNKSQLTHATRRAFNECHNALYIVLMTVNWCGLVNVLS